MANFKRKSILNVKSIKCTYILFLNKLINKKTSILSKLTNTTKFKISSYNLIYSNNGNVTWPTCEPQYYLLNFLNWIFPKYKKIIKGNFDSRL